MDSAADMDGEEEHAEGIESNCLIVLREQRYRQGCMKNE